MNEEPMPYVDIRSSVNVMWLAHQLRDHLSQDALIDFILEIDKREADLNFTTKLYSRLGDLIRDELGADDER